MSEDEKAEFEKDKKGESEPKNLPQSQEKADLEENKNEVRILLLPVNFSCVILHDILSCLLQVIDSTLPPPLIRIHKYRGS